MESATVRRAPPLPGLIEAGLVVSLLVLAAVSWAVTLDRMGGMDAGPGTDLGSLGWFLVAWVAMMAAMMFPSVAPTVVAYARIHRGSRAGGRIGADGATALFVAGYLAAWAAAGLLGYMVIEGARSLDLGLLSWEDAGRYLAGGVIVGAGLYQLSAPKNVCLRHCRTPMRSLLEGWRPGRIGALRLGVEHGAVCLGCCWALMAALFALGVMSVGWMLVIAAVIAIEKLLPWSPATSRAVAAVLIVLGLAVAFVPDDVPGLTVPGTPAAARAMEAMGMESGEGAGGDGSMAPGMESGEGKGSMRPGMDSGQGEKMPSGRMGPPQ